MLLLKKAIVAFLYFSALYNLAQGLPITENTQDTEEVLATTEGSRTSQPLTFQPQASTPNLSTPDFSNMNFSSPDFSNMNF